MSRLPSPGGDVGQWGIILNDYLSVAHKSDGTLADGSVTNATVSSSAAISADKTADGTTNKVYTATEKTKLAGIATNATANATDAALRDRSTHTGTQAASTISGTAVVQSTYTTKGDILAATAASTPARLAVGANGYVLTADSTQSAGVRWALPASGFTDPLTTKGDIMVRSSSATTRQSVGNDGQMLVADSTQTNGLKWVGGRNAGVFNVKDYGASGTGSVDDTAAINAAIAAALAAPGGNVYFPPGTYGTSSVIEVPENVTLEGVHGDTIPYSTSPAEPCVIKPLASHTGVAVFRLRGISETGRAKDHVGARFINITIDGSNMGATPATKGISVTGLVREARFEYVTITTMNDTSFYFGGGTTDTSKFPQSCRLIGCLSDSAGKNASGTVVNTGANGYTFLNFPDTTVIDCNALGSASVGFYVAGFMNGQITNCRAEWSGNQGFYITSGYWGTGQGSGGLSMLACTTDRNDKDGIRIDSTGGAGIQLTNCTLRRDGRNGGNGAGNFAALAVVNSNMPLVVTNVTTYPGVDDGGGGVNSPQIGVLATNSTSAVITSGYLHAATTAFVNGGGNGAFVIDGTVGFATGTGAAPTRVAPAGNVKATTPQTVTYAATTTLDTSLSNHFRVTLTGNITLAAPTNPTDGQRILIELIQDGTGGRTATLNAVFNVTTSITGAITLNGTAGTRSYIGAVYRTAGAKWDILAFGTGIAA